MNWQSLLEHVPDDSLLISTPAYKLLRFHCPIQATCVEAIAGYHIGDLVSIQGITQQKGSELFYLIDEIHLPNRHFHITT
jgi:hypothetical protein